MDPVARNSPVLLLVLLFCASLLLGCEPINSNKPTTTPTVTQHVPTIGATFGATLPEAELPALASAPLLTEPLAVVSWESDRCERTSFCEYGEVESGIYGNAGYSLGYAEKNDLDNWYVVCPYPDCKHFLERDGCPANVDGAFALRNGRIYYAASEAQYSKVWRGTMETYGFLASVALDGTDTRLEHTFDLHGIIRNTIAQSIYVWSDYMIYARSVLNDEGRFDSQILILDEDGEHLIYSEETDLQLAGGFAWAVDYNTFGDRVFNCGILDPTWSTPYTFGENYEIIPLNLGGLPLEGAHFSGMTYRCFRPNDGYYDVNLETREETRLEDAQLENSYAFVVLPNCILESTLMGYSSVSDRSAVQTHAMKLFDGQRWWDAKLPEELLVVQPNEYLDVQAVTSDRILLCLRDNEDRYNVGYVYYQIFLGTEHPVMEYAGTVEYQELPESW